MTRGHGIRGRPHGSRVTVSPGGQIEVNAERIREYLAARIPGIVQRRTQAGIDSRGKPFKPYSPEYMLQRAKSGRSTKASLWLTGGMVGSYGLRRVQLHGTTITLFFGPATTTSASLGSKGSIVTGRRSPPHNLLGFYHEVGAGDLPKRRWIGLSRAELKTVAEELEGLRGVWHLKR